MELEQPERIDGHHAGMAEREREFVAFFDAHFGHVRRMAGNATRSTADIEDVCALVFTVAHRRFDEVRLLAEPQVRAWLFRTVGYVAAGLRRSAARRRRLIARLERQPLPAPSQPAEVFEHTVDQAARRAHAERVRLVLAGLDMRHRELLEMADYQRRSGPDIAAELGITAQAARLRLMRARRAFRAEYVRRFGAPGDRPDEVRDDTPNDARGDSSG